MKSDTVSVIILNWNGVKFLPSCIESIRNQTYKNIEIVVVDNGSTDSSVELLQNDFAEIHLIKNEQNLGFAQGMNIGIAATRGDVVLLLNEDAYLDVNFVALGVKEFKENRSLAWVGGQVLEMKGFNRTDVVINAAFALRPRFQLMTLPNIDTRQHALMVSPCAMLLRRTSIIDCALEGGDFLDSHYFAYWEDTDLALRLLARGWKCIFVPEMRVWHAVSGSFGGKRGLTEKPVKFQRMSLGNRYRTIIKNLPADLAIRMIPVLVIVELIILPYFAVKSIKTMFCSLGAVLDIIRSFSSIIKQRQYIQKRRTVSAKELRNHFQGLV